MLDFYKKFAGQAAARLWSADWLKSLENGDREALITCSALKSLAKKKTVFWVGDDPDGLWGVLSGSVVQTAAPNECGPILFHIHQPGAWFGVTSLFGPQVRRTTNVTTRSSLLVHLPLGELERIGVRSPSLWRALGELCADQWAESIGSLDDRLNRSGRERIVATILRLANARRPSAHGSSQIEIDVTQADIAHLVGYSRTIVSRHLNSLRSEGLIDCAYARLELLDIAALQQFLRD